MLTKLNGICILVTAYSLACKSTTIESSSEWSSILKQRVAIHCFYQIKSTTITSFKGLSYSLIKDAFTNVVDPLLVVLIPLLV